MKKLRLDLYELTVETFDTRAPDAPAPGTVRGAQEESVDASCDTAACETYQTDGCGSCDYTCTCPYTFDGHMVDTYRTCVIACPVCWI